MTDDVRPEAAAASETGAASAGSPAPTGRSAAAAARRARRIGGVAGGAGAAASGVAPARPRPGPEAGEDAGRTDPVDLGKPVAEATVTRARPAPEQPPGAGDERPAARPWVRWVPAGVLTLGAVVMLALTLIFGIARIVNHGRGLGQPSSAQTRDRVLAAAKACMVDINTYDYRSLDAYRRRALACTTGSLSGELSKAIDSIVKVRAPQLKASQQIQVHEVGIDSVTPKHWTLLVFAQVNLKSVTYPSGSRTPYAAEIEMTNSHGKWLVSRETTLGSTTGQGVAGPSGSSSGSPSTGPSGSVSTSPSPATSPTSSGP